MLLCDTQKDNINTYLAMYVTIILFKFICILFRLRKMLNKNTLGVKKYEANQKPQCLYKQPKILIVRARS